MEKQRQKSIQKSAKAIFKKAEEREKADGDHFETGWLATLELMLLMMEEQLVENPGQLLPMQISGDDEWEFYLYVMEKLDLPPDTGAVLVSPSAFKEMKLSEFPEFEDSEMAPWRRNAYSLIISHLRDHTIILQASLPSQLYQLMNPESVNHESTHSPCHNFDASDLCEHGKCWATVFISGTGYYLHGSA
jgi:hypothetical protein